MGKEEAVRRIRRINSARRRTAWDNPPNLLCESCGLEECGETCNCENCIEDREWFELKHREG